MPQLPHTPAPVRCNRVVLQGSVTGQCFMAVLQGSVTMQCNSATVLGSIQLFRKDKSLALVCVCVCVSSKGQTLTPLKNAGFILPTGLIRI